MAKSYCYSCGEKSDYTVHKRVTSRKVRSMSVQYDEKYAVCNRCGKEIEIPGDLLAENESNFIGVFNGLRGCGLL